MYQHLVTGIALYLVLAVAVSQHLGDRRSADKDGEIAKDSTARVEDARDGIDREQVVAQVLATLSPEIEMAVAEALASSQIIADSGSSLSGDSGLSSSSGLGLPSSLGSGVSSSPGSGLSSSSGLELSSAPGSGFSSSSSGSGISSSPGSGSSSFSSSGLSSSPESGSSSSKSGLSSTADPSGVNARLPSLPGVPIQPNSIFGPTARPVYNFAYKVAGEADQTYLAQSEERDGDSLSGVYHYVNPAGALVTVNYNAGPDGFHQTLAQQDGFLNTHQQAVAPQLGYTEVSAKSDIKKPGYESVNKHSSGLDNEDAGGTELADNKPPHTDSVSLVDNSKPTSSSISPSVNKQALIDQVISALQPDIAAAVKAALEKTKHDASFAKVSPVKEQRKQRPETVDHGPAPEKNVPTSANPRPAPAYQRPITADLRPVQVDKPAQDKYRPSPAKQRPVVGHGGTFSGLSQAGNVKLEAGTGTTISGNKGSSEAGGDIMSTFGSGHFVRIKTPNIDISY